MRSRVRLALAAGLTATAACLRPGVFACEDDEQCASSGGVCSGPGYCAFPDADCKSGLAYGEYAGGGLGGTCVEAESETGTTESGDGDGESSETTSGTSETGESTDTTGLPENCGNGMLDPGEYCDTAVPHGQCASDCQQIDCDIDWGDCNDVAVDGCELALDQPTACGGCDELCDATVCADGQCAMLVFVTSSATSGAFGGIPGADDLCQSEAQGHGLTGTYRSWVGVSGQGPATNFVHAQVPYVRSDGMTIAADWDALIAQQGLDVPILLTLDMGVPPNSITCPSGVWTNLGPDAVVLDDSACSGFSSFAPDETARTGHWGATSSAWTDGCLDTCDKDHPLYCFQQPD